MKKKGIYINALGNEGWIGGLYYKKNILFSIIQNKKILQKYNIIVMVDRKNCDLFKDLKDYIILDVVSQNDRKFKIMQMINVIKYKIKFAYPSKPNLLKKILGVESIEWIPDFQHLYFPEFFDQQEICNRNAEYNRIANENSPLILSSSSAADDFYNNYGKKKSVYVVPFVSYIESNIKEMTADKEKDTLKKYDINDDYACICNQFWKHKNHILVLKAIKMLAEKNIIQDDFKFVFTGYPKDKRNPEYYGELISLLEDVQIKKYVKVLGFIDREEQIIVMKNSKFVIQPSLFEGWGTVVEDAKVLDKLILLSDIPVHREQMNENCVLFNPNSVTDLMEKILLIMEIKHKDNVENGIKKMYENAAIYSKNMEKIFLK